MFYGEKAERMAYRFKKLKPEDEFALGEPGAEKVLAEKVLTEHSEQKLVNIFFDHFYNRVIHYNPDPEKKVNVPYNFLTPEKWRKKFEARGTEQEVLLFTGFDQRTVPEYHTLQVFRKLM